MDGRIQKGRVTRDRLVTAARELFARDGYDATSIGAVLAAAGVARGALYHHFATKEDLFDTVLDREVARIAALSAEAARAAPDPVEALRAGCRTWLKVALDPAVQRIVLLDPPAVVGWNRWRELDEQHTLGGLRASIERIAAGSAGPGRHPGHGDGLSEAEVATGQLPEGEVDVLAHMILAAVSEAALLIAQADDPQAALTHGQAAVDRLITRLFAPR